jgi:hypothetical protein
MENVGWFTSLGPVSPPLLPSSERECFLVIVLARIYVIVVTIR